MISRSSLTARATARRPKRCPRLQNTSSRPPTLRPQRTTRLSLLSSERVAITGTRRGDARNVAGYGCGGLVDRSRGLSDAGRVHAVAIRFSLARGKRIPGALLLLCVMTAACVSSPSDEPNASGTPEVKSRRIERGNNQQDEEQEEADASQDGDAANDDNNNDNNDASDDDGQEGSTSLPTMAKRPTIRAMTWQARMKTTMLAPPIVTGGGNRHVRHPRADACRPAGAFGRIEEVRAERLVRVG